MSPTSRLTDRSVPPGPRWPPDLAVNTLHRPARELLLAVAEREESCEEMSVPGSPQSEAIQHSSVSTSNG
ncbi:hypothetical protein CRUP_003501, partial [Coryphaenoides rupestris]